MLALFNDIAKSSPKPPPLGPPPVMSAPPALCLPHSKNISGSRHVGFSLVPQSAPHYTANKAEEGITMLQV